MNRAVRSLHHRLLGLVAVLLVTNASCTLLFPLVGAAGAGPSDDEIAEARRKNQPVPPSSKLGAAGAGLVLGLVTDVLILSLLAQSFRDAWDNDCSWDTGC